MLCGPIAVARITGWSVDQVVLHVRALREASDQRLSLRGGTTVNEMWDALRRARWHVGPCEQTTLGELGKDHPDHWYFVMQPNHFFAFKRCLDMPRYRGSRFEKLRVRAWRVSRRPIPHPQPEPSCQPVAAGSIGPKPPAGGPS